MNKKILVSLFVAPYISPSTMKTYVIDGKEHMVKTIQEMNDEGTGTLYVGTMGGIYTIKLGN